MERKRLLRFHCIANKLSYKIFIIFEFCNNLFCCINKLLIQIIQKIVLKSSYNIYAFINSV